MGTRATITVHDNDSTFVIYRHWDGAPDDVVEDLRAALVYAWPLPRFESTDFAAAIVRAWKTEGGGDIYLTDSADRHSDAAFHYVVTHASHAEEITVTWSGGEQGHATISRGV